ncbi:DUF6907 domain-containing protein [Nocardia sp. GCM10030253]|uniref:DUF6907 domain-containing protein n=1 Tax=Nocardia sp. GCM10030253 TaxID=3273404 RepID=UPI003625FFD6
MFSCPAWCVDHRDPHPGDPEDGGTHSGPEVAINLDDPLEFDTTRQAWIQSTAHDRDGRRHCLIGLVDPHGVTVELSAADARMVAHILIRGADLRSAPVDGDCPSSCLGHTDASSAPARIRRPQKAHRPPATSTPADLAG